MNFSLQGRKNKQPAAFSLFREFYFDYAKSQSKKERNLSSERDNFLPKKNHTDKFSQFVHSVTSRGAIHNSPRSICADENMKKTQQFSGSKEGKYSYFKDHFSTNHPLLKPHPLIKKEEMSTQRLNRQSQTRIWKQYLKGNDGQLKNPFELRKQAKEMKKKMMILNEDKNEKMKVLRKNFLIEKHQRQSKVLKPTFNKTTFQQKSLLPKRKENIFPQPHNL